MTREEFMAELRAAGPGNWKVREDKYVRWESDDLRKYFCPLTFVCWRITGIHYNVQDYNDAGDALEMSHDDIESISGAADWKSFDFQSRRELLEACGLPVEIVVDK
jgi:hypothetical protein